MSNYEFVEIEDGFVAVRPTPIWKNTPLEGGTVNQDDINKIISDLGENNSVHDDPIAEIKSEDKSTQNI